MKRDPALISLSRDHHQALSVALRLHRATAETATEAQADALRFWTTAGRAHIRLRRRCCCPPMPVTEIRITRSWPRVLCDHVATRQRMDALARDAPPEVACLRERGAMLSDHIRLEERELFALIEQTLPAAELAALPAALQHAEGPATGRSPSDS